jgi:UDP-N-acetylglucosamine 1-carboxyvinyltransferase
MDKFVIHGGKELSGTVRVEGAKNAALPIIAGALLIKHGKTVLHNIPPLRDIDTFIAVLRHIGAQVEFDRDRRSMIIDAGKLANNTAPYEMMSKMRASFLVLGPVLQRMGEAVISLPGGCSLGPRPVNYHIKGFQELGADVSESQGYIVAHAKRLKGNTVYFDRPSHTGTENLIYGGVLAQGTTRLVNAACDPEVDDLACFLNRAGARISGVGTPTIVIEGVDELHAVEHTVMGDRLEAGTVLLAALACGGDVAVTGAETSHLEIVLKKMMETGAEVFADGARFGVRVSKRIRPVDAVTYPFPGFPTDLQACLMAVLSVGDGISRIRETIFEDRFTHVMELRRLGADISVDGNLAIITGVDRLVGATVMASDIRAGAGLVLAGLAASGTTEVLRVYHIDRGYYRLEEKLQALGADIQRMSA